MTEAELWRTWWLWVAIASAIILVAAALLITIWLTARSILSHAGRALAAAELIREQTTSIWALQTTNAVGGELVETTRAIEETTRALAGALESHAGAGGAR